MRDPRTDPRGETVERSTGAAVGREGIGPRVPELQHPPLAGKGGGEERGPPSSAARGQLAWCGGCSQPLSPPHCKFHRVSFSPHSSIKSTCLNRAVLRLP